MNQQVASPQAFAAAKEQGKEDSEINEEKKFEPAEDDGDYSDFMLDDDHISMDD